ncbi:MAG TPA: hypothetical protein VMT03_21745 [Polyangia bacterium]|nr:hypothetical protein [Polyangia bacterium]
MLLAILAATTTGACSQSLTGDMTGRGGSATVTGGTGGVVFGSGGTGGTSPGAGGTAGSNDTAFCDTLSAEYFSAIAAAGTCQVGASGQCQQLVSSALSGCSCPTYVTDGSALAAIETAWQTSGCATGAKPPCDISCPAALDTACVPTDGGSAGSCSYVPGTGGSAGTGGNSGVGGSGGSSTDAGAGACDTLAAEYAAVLIGARSCTADAADQCAQSVISSLSPCGTCTEFVNDRSVLDAIRRQWDAAGCGKGIFNCPLEPPCPSSTVGLCLPGDAGNSVCVSGVLL